MHRYILEKYSGQNSRYTCPKCGRSHCFTRYVDTYTNQSLADDVGMCDHRHNCGYHKPPKEFFKERRNEYSLGHQQYIPKVHPIEKAVSIDLIPMRFIEALEKLDKKENTLKGFLLGYFRLSDLQQVFSAYHIGTTKNGEVVFPQIDIQGECRTAKIMAYDKYGHRIKGERDCIDWLHARIMKEKKLKPSDWNLKQCLFGEHLLSLRPDDMVCLVESEKTAIICALKYPQYIWLACGGKHNLKPEMCKALVDRNVLLYPDADAVIDWEERSKQLSFCRKIKISNWYKDEPEGSKRDIADCILEEAESEVKPTTIGDVCQWLEELKIEKGRVIFNI